ncbi:hypothetical protein IJL65_02420 [bacterium]|nr:hypothetical protein [bacterium]
MILPGISGSFMLVLL